MLFYSSVKELVFWVSCKDLNKIYFQSDTDIWFLNSWGENFLNPELAKILPN